MRPLAFGFALYFLLACGDSSGTGASAGAGGSNAGGSGGSSGTAGAGGAISPRGSCDASERVGRFTVEKQKEFGVVQGSVADGVVPSSVPEVVSESGGCRLLKRQNFSCTPSCIGAETCGQDGVCIPYPRQVSVGTVTITGLTTPAVMEPQNPGNGYFAPDAENPPYTPGSAVNLSAAGAESHEGFALYGVGSEPLETAPTWILAEGSDLEVSWPAPTVETPAAILVELTIDQHGSSPLTLQCEFEDTGAAAVPASVIDQLINSGVSGFPNGKIVRRTVDNTSIDVGCVELVVGSPLAANVSVAGFIPCNSPDDCPKGQTCNIAIEICE
jgi:hypothetical protein